MQLITKKTINGLILSQDSSKVSLSNFGTLITYLFIRENRMNSEYEVLHDLRCFSLCGFIFFLSRISSAAAMCILIYYILLCVEFRSR